jgi:hypothetical protein
VLFIVDIEHTLCLAVGVCVFRFAWEVIRPYTYLAVAATVLSSDGCMDVDAGPGKRAASVATTARDKPLDVTHRRGDARSCVGYQHLAVHCSSSSFFSLIEAKLCHGFTPMMVYPVKRSEAIDYVTVHVMVFVLLPLFCTVVLDIASHGMCEADQMTAAATSHPNSAFPGKARKQLRSMILPFRISGSNLQTNILQHVLSVAALKCRPRAQRQVGRSM